MVCVGAVGEVTDAKTEHIEMWSVLHRDRHHANAKHVKRGVVVDIVKLEFWLRSRMCLFAIGECIVKRTTNTVLDGHIAVQRHRRAEAKRKEP